MRIPHNEPLASAASAQPARNDPERRCILTGNNGSRDDLVRLAIAPDGLVLPDALARAPGGGAGLVFRAKNWKRRSPGASSRPRWRGRSRARR